MRRDIAMRLQTTVEVPLYVWPLPGRFWGARPDTSIILVPSTSVAAVPVNVVRKSYFYDVGTKLFDRKGIAEPMVAMLICEVPAEEKKAAINQVVVKQVTTSSSSRRRRRKYKSQRLC